MQGWFAYGYDFLPTNNLNPVFIGTHFTNQAQNFLKHFIVHFPHYFQDQTIGCRDDFTLEFCKKFNINSYLSRCLTLAFDKRENGDYKKVFFVNIDERFKKYFPQDILENAEFINQRGVLHQNKSWEHLYQSTQDLLMKYKNEARLIITTALHCAAPATAMGINVVLIKTDSEQDTRFGALNGILKVYNLDDLKNGNIDFNAQAPNIEALKILMLENLHLSVLESWGKPIDKNKLKKIRKDISEFKI